MTNELFGWSESTWHLIDQISVLFGVVTGITWFAGILVGIFKREALRRWFIRNRFPNVGAELREKHNWDALAFTVSHRDVPLWVMEVCQPRHIGLIATEGSRAAARDIAAQAQQRGIKVAETVYLDNPDDPAEARDRTRHVLESLKRADAANIAIDITGGKTTMSLGAFMAAEEMGISSLYVTAPYDNELRRPVMRNAQIHCISRPE